MELDELESQEKQADPCQLLRREGDHFKNDVEVKRMMRLHANPWIECNSGWWPSRAQTG
jgi:hypothetical protein